MSLEYENDDGVEVMVKIPCQWEICFGCGGDGGTTSHIEPDGGGFTASEWAEACYDDPDFGMNYMSGYYDRSCEECGGSGKVSVPIQYDKLTKIQQDALDYHEEGVRMDNWERNLRARGIQY